MASSDGEREGSASREVRSIERGWSVYDALERPIGNVSDVEGGRLQVDGRPQGMDFYEVSLQSVRRAGDGEVHLDLQMEQLGGGSGPAAAVATTTAADDETDRLRVTAAAAPTGATAGEPISGSSYTASGTPVGLGSNTPVGSEPSTYRAWEEDEGSFEQGFWSRYWAWLTPAVAGVAGLLGLLWWRRRQARRRPLDRVRETIGSVGESFEPLWEDRIEPLWDAAVERKRGWWVAPLAALPLLLYLRSTREEEPAEPRRDSIRDYLPDGQVLKARLQAARLPEQLRAAGLAERRPEDTSGFWWAAIPALAGALAAVWYSTRRERPAGGARRLGDVMTRNAQVVRPETTAFEAASLMKSLDVGVLPVCDGRRVEGIVTDRDIVVRAVAEGRDPLLTTVQELMSRDLVYAREDDDVARGAALMRQHQIRRLPIVDRDNNLVGIVSLGDLAVDAGDDRLSGSTLEDVSAPARPRR